MKGEDIRSPVDLRSNQVAITSVNDEHGSGQHDLSLTAQLFQTLGNALALSNVEDEQVMQQPTDNRLVKSSLN